MLSSLRRSSLLALLATLSAVGLAACGGGGGGGSDESASQVISQTFGGKKEVNSGKLDMNVSAELEGTGAASQIEGPVTIKLAGPFQTRGNEALPEVDLDLSVSGGGQTFTAGALTTGTAAFISYQGTDYKVPAGQFRRLKRQIERDARRDKNNSFTFAQLGINPRKWILNPKNEGTEEVGGAQTIHVSADVNVAAFVNDLDDLLGRASSLGVQTQQLPRSLTERQKKSIEEAIQDVRFDLWTGEEDKILRRIELEFGFDVPKNLQQDTQGVQRGKVELALEIADINKEQDIKPPSDARPLSELQSALGFAGTLGEAPPAAARAAAAPRAADRPAAAPADRPAVAHRAVGRGPTSAPVAASRVWTASAPSAISIASARPRSLLTSRNAPPFSRNSGSQR